MSDTDLAFAGAPDARAYVVLERRLQALRESVFVSTPDVVLREFTELRGQVDKDVQALKRRMFAPSHASSDDDKAAARWISTQHRRLARVARRMAEGFARLSGANEHTLRLVALALHYMGESVKGHVKESHHHGGLHALMRIALKSGRHRGRIQLDVDGHLANCTLESLYFRALLLAQMAGGGLTFAQTEILDAWLWIWMPALVGVDVAPEGPSWRADLDSNEGLRRKARVDAGPSLYLAHAPLEVASHAIVDEFHRGRTVPASGQVSTFPIEDHIAVLDAVRRGLRRVRREPVARARRQESNSVVQLHVGLAEIMAKGFGERIPDAAPRTAQLLNVSDTGVGLEGEEGDCAGVAVDDVVAMRLAPAEPLVVGRVVRCLPAATEGRVVIGIQRMSSAAQPVRARRAGPGSPLHDLLLLYVPGTDDTGRHDSYLTSESIAVERDLLETAAGGDTFTFRFNRVRERGRGWVTAGFEITASRRGA
jgi:hypothetical protein